MPYTGSRQQNSVLSQRPQLSHTFFMIMILWLVYRSRCQSL